MATMCATLAWMVLRSVIMAVLLVASSAQAQTHLAFSLNNANYVAYLDPVTYEQAVASCALVTPPFLQAAALLPLTMLLQLLSKLTAEQPDTLKALLSGVGASGPAEQQQWSMWTWDEHRVCRAAKLLGDPDSTLVTADRPCAWRLAYVCVEEQAVPRAAGYTSSSDWYRRYLAPGAPAALPPSGYTLGPGSGPGKSGLVLFRSGLVVGGDFTNVRRLNHSTTSVTLPFDDSDRFWTHGPVVSALYRGGNQRLTALRLLREAEAADGWSMYQSQGQNSSASELSLTLGVRENPISGDVIESWEMYNVGPYNDYIVAVEGCFRAFAVESLLLISRTGRRYQLGRGGCTGWFREDAPSGGYLAGVAGRHLNTLLWDWYKTGLGNPATIGLYYINQAQLVWAAPVGSSPPIASVRQPHLLQPATSPACPNAALSAFRYSDNMVTACRQRERICNSNTCCGSGMLALADGLTYYTCGNDIKHCRNTCANNAGMCNIIPEAPLLHFVGTAASSSSAASAPLTSYIVHKDLRLLYDAAVQYCIDSTYMGLDWELITAQDSLNWLSSLETRRDAYTAITDALYFWLASPSSQTAAAGPPDMCLRGAFGTPHSAELFPHTFQATFSCSSTAAVVCRAVSSPGQDIISSSSGLLPAPGSATDAVWVPGLHLVSSTQRRYGNGPYNTASAGVCNVVLGALNSSNARTSVSLNATSRAAGPVTLDRPIMAVGVSVAVQLGNETDSVAVVSGLRVRLLGDATRGGEEPSSTPSATSAASDWHTTGAASTGGWDTLELAAGEVVVAVSGCYGGFLERMVLHTSGGRRWTHPLLAATACSVPFLETAPQAGGYLVGLQAAYGMYVEMVQLIWGQPLGARGPPRPSLSSNPAGGPQSIGAVPSPAGVTTELGLPAAPRDTAVLANGESPLSPHPTGGIPSSGGGGGGGGNTVNIGVVVGAAVGGAAVLLAAAALVVMLRLRALRQQQLDRQLKCLEEDSTHRSHGAGRGCGPKGELASVSTPAGGGWAAGSGGSEPCNGGNAPQNVRQHPLQLGTVLCVLDSMPTGSHAAIHQNATRSVFEDTATCSMSTVTDPAAGDSQQGFHFVCVTSGTTTYATTGIASPSVGHPPNPLTPLVHAAGWLQHQHSCSSSSGVCRGAAAGSTASGAAGGHVLPSGLPATAPSLHEDDVEGKLSAYIFSKTNMSLSKSYGDSTDVKAAAKPATPADAAADTGIASAILTLHAELLLAGRHNQLQVKAVLAKGAFGVVYLGTWRGLRVAVKTLVVHDALLDGQSRQRHRAILEAAISKSLQHPNVVSTYEAEVVPLAVVPAESGLSVPLPEAPPTALAAVQADAGDVFKLLIIQEYCNVGSLTAALGAGVVGSVGAGGTAALCALTLALDVARGMRHIHSRNIIHGDLSSGNVLLSSCGRNSDDGGGAEERQGEDVDDPADAAVRRQLAGLWRPPVLAKVSDFGLSVPMGANQTHASNRFQGTPGYTAPEVLARGHLSRAADVWAFGVLVLEFAHGLRITHLRARRATAVPATASMAAGAGAPAGCRAGQPAKPSGDPPVQLPPPEPPWAALPAGCSARLGALVGACLCHVPAQRPTFEHVVECLVGIVLEQHHRYTQQQQH